MLECLVWSIPLVKWQIIYRSQHPWNTSLVFYCKKIFKPFWKYSDCICCFEQQWSEKVWQSLLLHFQKGLYDSACLSKVLVRLAVLVHYLFICFYFLFISSNYQSKNSIWRLFLVDCMDFASNQQQRCVVLDIAFTEFDESFRCGKINVNPEIPSTVVSE